MLEAILKEGNDFSANDVEVLSKQLFEIFWIDLKPNTIISKEEAKLKSKILNSYLKFFNHVLQAKIDASDVKKVELIKIINKLKLQLELLEMIAKTSKLVVPEGIHKAASHMGEKSQSSLRI